MDDKEVSGNKDELALAIAQAQTQRPVGSPCINVCWLDQTGGHCEGCLRSIEEIAAWKEMSDSDRLAVLKSLSMRLRTGRS